MWDGVQKGKEGERLENKAEVKEEKSHTQKKEEKGT